MVFEFLGIDFAVGEIVNIRHKVTKFAFPIVFVEVEFAEARAKTRFLRMYFHEERFWSLSFASRGEKRRRNTLGKRKNQFI